VTGESRPLDANRELPVDGASATDSRLSVPVLSALRRSAYALRRSPQGES